MFGNAPKALWGGRPLLERYGHYVLISREDLARADRWFARYGDWAVFLSRLVPLVRSLISVPAGIARMSLLRFLIFTFLGSYLWTVVLAYAGCILGEHYGEIREWMRPFDIPIIIALLALVGVYIYHHIRRRASASPQPSRDPKPGLDRAVEAEEEI